MGQILDQAYWNQRYLGNETGWDVGSVSTPLKTYFDQLKSKDLSILIPGAGNAYEAEYLFQQGFGNVYVCDLAPLPLDNLQQRCPGFDPAKLLLKDFFELDHIYFDCIIEQTFFCALNPALRPAYFKKMLELLNPGGHLAGVLFNDALNADKPPYGGTREEYLAYIPSSFEILQFDLCYNSIRPRAGREIFMNLRKRP